MNNITITGDGNVVGNGNVVTITRTSAEINEQLINLIHKLAGERKEELMKAVVAVQDDKTPHAKKEGAARTLGKWLTTVAGELGKTLLVQMATSPTAWQQMISSLVG